MFVRRVSLALLAALTVWLLGSDMASGALVAYWHFDTDFSATVGGPTYDATPTFGASISGVESKWGGGAAHFDKASMAYATTTASPVPSGTYSFSHWYYLDVAATSTSPDRQFATVNSNNEASEPSLFFNIDGDDGAEPGNEDDILVYRVLHDGPGLGQSFLIRPIPRPTNHQQWVNFIATVAYDAETNTTTVEGFYNGESLGFNQYGGSQQVTTGRPEASTHLVFGADRGLVARFWEGYIDDVAVYDHVLSASEIATLQTGPAVGAPPVPTGDYNGNGTVDAADYVVWRDTLGATVTAGEGADGDASGTVDVGDYDFWKARFGDVAPGLGSSVAVPEPGTVTLALLAVSMGAIRFQTKPRKHLANR